MTDPTANDPLGLRSLESDTPAALNADALFRDVSQQVAAEKGPVAWLRNRSTAHRLWIATAAVMALALGVHQFMGRADWSVFPSVRMALVLGALATLYALMVRFALLPAHKPAPSPSLVLALAAVGMLLPFVQGLLPMAHELHPLSLRGTGDELIPLARTCFIWGSMVGIPLVLLVALLDRDTQASSSRVVFTALCGGIAGVLALQLKCPITHPMHLLMGHATVATGMVVMYGLFHLVRRSLGR